MLLVASACGGAGTGGSELSDVLDPSQTVRDGVAAQFEQAQQLIEVCMSEQGFEYVPLAASTAAGGPAVRGAVAAAIDEEYTAAEGYGIANRYADSIGSQDPNDEIRNALSETDRQSYDRTWQECTLTAQTDVGISGRVELSMQLWERVEELDDRILSDARVVELTPVWAECMSDRGYDYGRVEEPFEDMSQTVLAGVDLFVSEGGGYEDGVDQALADLRRSEQQVAMADLECRKASGVAEAIVTVRDEQEAAFLSDNGDLVDQYRQSLPNDG